MGLIKALNAFHTPREYPCEFHEAVKAIRMVH